VRFDNIALLTPALIIGIITLYALIWRDLKFRKVNFSNFQSLAKSSGTGGYLHLIPDALKIIGIVFLIIALLRPQQVKKDTQDKIKGIDIMIALDLSGSMQADDLKPSRVEAAKQVCREFVSGLSNDRVGLVVFAGMAFSQCPLTVDYDIVRSFIDQVDLTTVRVDGTAMGDAVITAANRLETSGASKIIILTTDGINNRGVNPVDAAKIAAYKGIKIYTIGIGKKGGANAFFMDQFGNKRMAYNQYTGQPIKWEEPDENTLKQIAFLTGGQYFRATNEQSLKEIYGLIGKMEKQDIQIKTYEKYTDLFGYFLWSGFLLLAAALMLETFKFTRVI
jgi:Ca-activated chloride channel family protein